MTTTTVPARRASSGPGRPGRQGGAAHAFLALLSRDMRVARKEIISLSIRAIIQPALTVFVFSYVLPRIGTNPFGNSSANQPAFSTILVPGLVASSIVVQGILAVTAPLMMELSYTREIEDRVLAPIPAWLLGLEKIVSGSVQALISGLVVFPFVLLVHTRGQAPRLDFRTWPELVLVLVLASLATSAFAILLGTIIDPRKLSTIFPIIVVPMTMLGCVYYPWQALHQIPWLQYLLLANPLVYVSEALRAALTPGIPHINTWILLPVLAAGTALLAAIAARSFVRRVTD